MGNENPFDLKRNPKVSGRPRILEKIELLRVTFHIFKHNHADLKRYLDAYKQPSFALDTSGVGNDYALIFFLREITRFFHNYVAAVGTLVDHTRTLAREMYAETEFWKEYDDQVGQYFRNSPLHHFVTGLRNYTLHMSLPLVGSSVGWGVRTGAKTSVILNVDSLRGWDGWSALARQHMEGLGWTAKLDEIVDRYTEDVVSFHEWFARRQQETLREVFA